MKNFNGICYNAFPSPYNPSMANGTCIFYGSDIAYDPMAPIWGSQYTSSTGSSCGPNPPNQARNDIKTVSEMGVNLIRLYDWDPRNNHWNFLDYCNSFNIKVLVPVSNYFLLDGFPNRNELIPKLIKSFSNREGTDYHSAIAGIIIANEPRISGIPTQNCIDFTISWSAIEASGFSAYRKVMIGHPVDFDTYGGQYPCFGFWTPLLNALKTVPTLSDRMFLAPQTYNTAEYLFKDAESSGKGYIDIAYDQYKLPLLITEIGMGRDKPGYEQIVQGQLSGSITYGAANPQKLIGICFFQFVDKVWEQETSEGMFGAFSHSAENCCTIQYGDQDFTHWDNGSCKGSSLTVDKLVANPLVSIIKQNYKGA